MLLNELSNAACRMSLRSSGAELDGGGRKNAPPPSTPWKIQTTSTARVNLLPNLHRAALVVQTAPVFFWRRFLLLTLAVLVVWIFHGVLGGGAFLRPPRLTRLLSYIETCGRRRSKARPKSVRKYVGHL